MKTIPKKKILALHNRIAKLAKNAIDRGDILSCERIDDGYLIARSTELIPIKYTSVGAGSLLYLLNSLAEAQK